MSDLKMPLLGFGGILSPVLASPRFDVWYREDISTQAKFERYLSARRAHWVDPFEFSGVDPIH
jgi:hypothetical protein